MKLSRKGIFAPVMRRNSQTILIVDEDEVFCETESAMLGAHGFRVIFTTRPEECISILDREKVDIVLLGYKYKNTTGIEVYSKLREKYTIPVIMISGCCDLLIEEQFYALGGKLWIHKPFKTHELLQIITALLASANKKST